MRKKGSVCTVILVCLSLLVLKGSAFAGGFALFEGSVRGNGLAGCLIGKADDPSAVFFNPAGITQLSGTQMSTGLTIITPMTSVETERFGKTQDSSLKWNYFAPPYLYITHQMNDRFWLGFGFFARFGLGTEFDEDWPGNVNSYNAFVRVVELNPNIAYKLNDQLSVSGGVSIARMDLKLESKAPIFKYDTSLSGDGYGVGYNLGVHYKPLDWLKLGLSYRSKIHIDLDGRAEFIRPQWAGKLFHNGSIESTTTLPDELMLGINFQLLKNLSMELSTIRTGWSNFDQMTIHFNHPVAGMGKVTKEKNWTDVWRWQIGFEYNATSWLDLRWGYVYDNGPTPNDRTDYLIPANDRQMYCLGAGFKWRAWTIDLSYNYLLARNSHVSARPADGVLKGRFHDGQTDLYGIGIGYKF
jgi:long-chain fatty acid transport protein